MPARRELSAKATASVWPICVVSGVEGGEGEMRSEAVKCDACSTLIGTKLCVKPTQAEPTTKAQAERTRQRESECLVTLPCSCPLLPTSPIALLMLLLFHLQSICVRNRILLPENRMAASGWAPLQLAHPNRENRTLLHFRGNKGKLPCCNTPTYKRNFSRLSNSRCSIA